MPTSHCVHRCCWLARRVEDDYITVKVGPQLVFGPAAVAETIDLSRSESNRRTMKKRD